jgi:choice-of-anchor A domain-containing protein
MPQLGLGRLVEKPAEIAMMIDTFLNQPTVTPTNALVTGYTFLTQQANDVTAKLSQYGVNPIDTLNNDTWTAAQFRASFFGALNAPRPVARGLNSLNSHFAHNRFFPNDPDLVYADEVTASTTDYRGSLIFSVGCHSGLNAPDEYFPSSPRDAADWAQVFAGKGAGLVGNTGFGYADRDLLLYSSRLMVDFVDQLGAVDAGIPTTGRALLLAKQRYFNSLAAGTLSNYDEKVLGEMTLYGLPMQRISLPNQPPTGSPAAQSTTSFDLALQYAAHPTSGRGTYYTANGSDEFSSSVGAPVQPQVSFPLAIPNKYAHGVLMLGGTFTDTPNTDPVVTALVTDGTQLPADAIFPPGQFFPSQLANLNRFAAPGGQLFQRLVVVPGQFKADPNTSPTKGTERLYNRLQLEVLAVDTSNPDYIAPSIREVAATGTPLSLKFRVRAADDSGQIARVVVLYLPEGATSWLRAEPVYNSLSGYFEASVPPSGGTIQYFVQVADPSGNVAWALDHGNPYQAQTPTPTIPTFSAPPSANEGQTFALTIGDPSSGDSYAFDCGTGYGPFGTSKSTSCAPADNGTLVVKGKIRDANQAEIEFSANLNVANVPPSATFNAPSPVVAGSPINLSLTGASDPSSADTAAGFQFAFDCGAGFSPFGSGNSASCTTSTAGLRAVKGAIRDKDGGVTEYRANVTIVPAAPVAATIPASAATSTSATLNGLVNAYNTNATVMFQWGTSSGSYPNTITANPATVTGTTATAVSALLAGLTPNTTYYYRVVATSGALISNGSEQSFRTSAQVNNIDFNVFIFQNINHSSSTVQGRMAAGGDVTLNSYTIGSKLTNSRGTRDDLIAGGNLTFNIGSVPNGNVVYGGTYVPTKVTIKNGTARQDPNKLAGAPSQAWAIGIATTWANPSVNPINGKVSGVGTATLTLTGTDPNRNVFLLRSTDFANITKLLINISAPAGSVVIINVSGEQASVQNMGMKLTGIDRQHVLFNFFQATTLTIGQTTVEGTVWAPMANVTFSNGIINGTLLGQSLQGTSTTFGLAPFLGPLQ